MVSKLIIKIDHTSQEKKQLIALRTRLYRQNGKHMSSSDMMDQFDASATHVGVWRGREPIAATRVLNHTTDAEWEHDRFFNWPSTFPARHECTEISRFCITLRERNFETLRALCYGIAMAMSISRKRYIYACCTKELKPLYARLFGARFTGDAIHHTDLGPKPHYLFFADVKRIQTGAWGGGMTPLIWTAVWPAACIQGFFKRDLLQDESTFYRYLILLKCLACMLLQPLAAALVKRLALRRRLRRSRDIEGASPWIAHS